MRMTYQVIFQRLFKTNAKHDFLAGEDGGEQLKTLNYQLLLFVVVLIPQLHSISKLMNIEDIDHKRQVIQDANFAIM